MLIGENHKMKLTSAMTADLNAIYFHLTPPTSSSFTSVASFDALCMRCTVSVEIPLYFNA
jgi:hypothetical protein